jgi:hypothetical protein
MWIGRQFCRISWILASKYSFVSSLRDYHTVTVWSFLACHGLAIRRVTGNLQFLPRRCQSNAEIGRILEITPATVGKHLERIYPKLGVENRTAAASFASELTGRLAT